MIKVLVSASKYSECVSCGNVESPMPKYKISVSRSSEQDNTIILCEDCIRFLANSIKDAIKES